MRRSEMATYVDKSLTCVECKKEFVFTVKDQEFYATKVGADGKPWGEPKRCRQCRDRRKASKG